MDQNEQFMPDFWRQYQIIVINSSLAPGADLFKRNGKGQAQPLNLSSLYFRPFSIPGDICDVPHIGYQTDSGEVFFYLPRAHCKKGAIIVILRSCSELRKAGNTAHFQIRGPNRDVKLMIQIPPVQAMREPSSQAIVRLAYEKMLELFNIARKVLPEYKLR